MHLHNKKMLEDVQRAMRELKLSSGDFELTVDMVRKIAKRVDENKVKDRLRGGRAVQEGDRVLEEKPGKSGK